MLLPIVATGTASAQSATPSPTTTTASPAPTPTPTTAAIKPTKKPPKLNAWQKAVSQLPKSGVLSKQAALRLFALTFGPVPGVRVAKRQGVAQSGTPAIQAVMAHLSEYTPKQQQAIQRLINGGADAETFVSQPVKPAVPARAGDPARATFVEAPPANGQLLFDNLQHVRADYAQRLGFDVPGPIRLHIVPTPKTSAGRAEGQLSGVAGYATPHVTDTSYDGCDITLLPYVAFAGNYTNQHTLAHEAFHCFQLYVTRGQSRAGWIMEGSAEYAAAVETNGATNWWPLYLLSPLKPLFTRSYDGVGFYAHLAESGTDPFTVIRPMLLAATSEDAYAASGAPAAQFVDTWASSYYRVTSWSAAWNTNGPGMPPLRGTPPTTTVVNDSTQEQKADVAPYASALSNVHVDADLLEVKATGSVRISDGAVDVVVHGGQQFCAKPGGCGCPGSDGTKDPVQVKRDLAIGVTGNTQGAQATLTGLSTTDVCCASAARTKSMQGLSITPTVNCQRIGLQIDKVGGLKLHIDYALLVDHPRIVPRKSKSGKITSLQLEGVSGFELAFGAGVANYRSDNARFRGKVPIEVEVPVQPPTPGLPRSMKVTWSLDIRTAIAGNTSTLLSSGRYALSGAPLGPQRAEFALDQDLNTVESLMENIGGIALAPSGIVIAVRTKFSADKGTPAALKKTYAALNTSSSVTNGSALGFAVGICRQVTLDIYAASGGGKAPNTQAKLFHHAQVLTDDEGQLDPAKKTCKGAPSP